MLEEDEYKVVLSQNHPLAAAESIPIEKLEGQPFLLLEHVGKTEVSELLEKYGVRPSVCFTTWEDFAIMAMAEKGLGIGILPSLILSAFLTILRFARLRSPFTAGSGLPVKTKTAFRPRRENLRNTCAFAKRKREKNKQKPLEIFEGLSLSVVFYQRIT